MKKTNYYRKQGSIWLGRCCEEDIQNCSGAGGGPKQGPAESSFERQECEVRECLSEEAEKCKNTASLEKCNKNAWGMMRLERQARDEMNEETGYQRKGFDGLAWW